MPVIGKKSLKDIDKMKGLDFEIFVGELLTQHGYKTQNIKGSGDFGVDVIAEKGGTKYAVQVKRYQSNVSRTAVSDAVAGKFHWDCEKAWVITNSYFTSGAKILATSTDCKLTDRDELQRMMQDGSTFASIFEADKTSQKRKQQKSRSIWTLFLLFLLIGLAALGVYANQFIPQNTMQQFWQNTRSIVSRLNNANETPSSDLTPIVPVQPKPLVPITPSELPSGFAPSTPSGLHPVEATTSQSQSMDLMELIENEGLDDSSILDNSSILLDSGDNLRLVEPIGPIKPVEPAPEITQSLIPTTTLENTENSPITDLHPLEEDISD